MKEVFVTICSSAAVVHAQCGKALCGCPCNWYRAQTIAFSETKNIKPCDNNLKSAKVYRALDEGILVCFNMNREMEKKITPQGGGLRIF